MQQWAFFPIFHNVLAIYQKIIIWVYESTFQGVWRVRDLLKLRLKDRWNSGSVCTTQHHHCPWVVSRAAAAGEAWANGFEAWLHHCSGKEIWPSTTLIFSLFLFSIFQLSLSTVTFILLFFNSSPYMFSDTVLVLVLCCGRICWQWRLSYYCSWWN